MQVRSSLLALLLGLAACSGAGRGAGTTPGGAIEIEGVILGEGQAPALVEGVIDPAPTEFWTPELAQAARLEATIADYLAEAAPAGSRLRQGLEGYRAQYVGIYRGDRELIWANYFCQSQGVDLEDQLVTIDDGGDCYFTVLFDPATEAFDELHINGAS